MSRRSTRMIWVYCIAGIPIISLLVLVYGAFKVLEPTKVPQKEDAAIIEYCREIGEMGYYVAISRDRGVSIEDTLKQFPAGMPTDKESGVRKFVEAIYAMPQWPATQHKQFVELTCIKQELEKKR